MAKNSFEEQLITDLTSGFKAKKSAATASKLWDSTTKVVDWVPTGDFMLDLILSNRLDGGLPVGRLTEISGGEGAGKTLLASYILANTQKKGGVAILIDSEHAASMEVLERVGVDIDSLVYIQASTIEEVFQSMETIVSRIQTDSTNRLVTIVWDSVAATSTKAEIEGDYGDRTVALGARLISQALRKYIPIVSKHNVCLVFINQLRTNIGVTFGDNKITPGGKAIPYHASVRLRLEHNKQIQDGDKDLIGRIVKCDVKKNKVAPPMRSIYYTIRWGDSTGAWIDSNETMWDSAIRKNIIQKISQQKYSFTTSTGDQVEFSRKSFNELLKEESFITELKLALAEAYIITTKTVSSEDISYADAGEDG
jgi:recombination protein RecA